MDYSYQAVETGTGNVVTWTSPTPDLTGAGSGTTVDAGSVVQTNWPGPADGTNGFAWSGVGIAGSVLPEDVVLGAGLNGAWDLPTATLTLTGRSILDFYDANTSTLIAENIERVYLYGITGTPLLPGILGLSVDQSVIHAPVVAVTTGNIASTTGGLVKPSNAVELTEYRDPDTITLGWVSNYDGVAADLVEDDRVLVCCQTTASENGIYIYDGAKLVLSPETPTPGSFVPVKTGTHWAGTMWAFLTATDINPPSGAVTESAWYLVARQNGYSESERWVDILTLQGPSGASAGDYYLDVDVTASVWHTGEGDHRIMTARAMYHGNMAGDMAPLGDDLDSQFGLPWEAASTVRLRTVIDGSALTIQALAEDEATTTPGTQVSLAVKSAIRKAK